MIGPRAVRLLAAAAAVLLAAGIAVLAEETRRWPPRIEGGDATFVAAPGGRDAWTLPDGLAAGVAGDLLAVDDDLALRRGLQLVARARVARFVLVSRWIRLIAEAEAELAAADEGTGDRDRRSAAANLLGIVYFDGAQTSTTRRSDFLKASALAFERAIRLDVDNADAKYNLELLLTLLTEQRSRGGRRSGTPGGGPLGGDNAGLRLPGEGY